MRKNYFDFSGAVERNDKVCISRGRGRHQRTSGVCAIWPAGRSRSAKTYSGLDYPSLEAVVRVYLEEHNVEVEDGCIAIACPITGDWVAMTNHTWAFSIAEMKKNLGFSPSGNH